jgi:hypothetical protein
MPDQRAVAIEWTKRRAMVTFSATRRVLAARCHDLFSRPGPTAGEDRAIGGEHPVALGEVGDVGALDQVAGVPGRQLPEVGVLRLRVDRYHPV